jgi:L-rhamnono-1,4-lactonase
MCKPDMRQPFEEALKSGNDFEEWRTGIQSLANYPKTYVKLSGAFSELPPQDPNKPSTPRQIVDHIKPWTDVIFEAFGPLRIMFGSDWPVCNVGGAGSSNAWRNWQGAVELLLEEMGLSDEEKTAVWSGTAAGAYKTVD